MNRCLELAKQGAGFVTPNPMVGAILVHDGRIIGEGWHKNFGTSHAEVNCINSMKKEDRDKISSSVLYVSLEPCAHFGKTPPCTDLIINHKIPMVVIGCRDPFKEVSGKGMEKLKAAGVKVITGVMESECIQLNRRFFTFHLKHRPYVVLKWAETADGLIAGEKNERLLISNEFSIRLVHKWRSEEAAILVGTNTALLDDPELTTRNWSGISPVRLVVDMNLRLPHSLKIFNGKQRTIIFNKVKHDEDGMVQYYKITDDVSLVHQLVKALYQLKIQSVLVEGGARLLQSFIDKGMWDEIRVVKNEELKINKGLVAPVFKMHESREECKLAGDCIRIYHNK
jgi:diaminohydroxyphosphoribosylaminopyrimidine deaminase/5-amino-6-(5-phosphoribosylamino)uracil reductase